MMIGHLVKICKLHINLTLNSELFGFRSNDPPSRFRFPLPFKPGLRIHSSQRTLMTIVLLNITLHLHVAFILICNATIRHFTVADTVSCLIVELLCFH